MLCSLKCRVRLPVPPDGRFKGFKLSLTRIPLGLALKFTLQQSRQCPQPAQQSPGPAESPSAPLLLRGTEAQWGPKAACPVPPWPSCTLPVQCQPTFPLAALWTRADICVTVSFAGSPPGPSHSHSSQHPCSPAREAQQLPCHWQSLRASV